MEQGGVTAAASVLSPSSLSGSASKMALIKESVFLLAGGLVEGTAALITLAQRSSTDLFVNVQSGQIFSEVDATGSPGEPAQEPPPPGCKRPEPQPALKPGVSPHRCTLPSRHLDTCSEGGWWW